MTYLKHTIHWSFLFYCALGCDNSNDVARVTIASVGGSTPFSNPNGGTSQIENSGGADSGGSEQGATVTFATNTGGTVSNTLATGGAGTGGTASSAIATGGAATGGVTTVATGGAQSAGATQGGVNTGGSTQGVGGSNPIPCMDAFASRSVAVGIMPGGVISADLDGDDHLDLAVTSTYDNTIHVLLGDGHGNLAPGKVLPTGIDPESIASADVNRDGIRDLIVTNLGDDNVGVLLGTGGGAYAPQVTTPLGNEPMSIRVADMNHDAKPDVIVGSLNSSGNSLGFSVALGNGDGTFETPTDYSTGGQRTFVEVADFDDDGHLDVAAVSNISVLTLYYGDGTGQVTPGTSWTVGGGPSDIKAADMNNDGNLDILVANEDAHHVSVLLARGPRSYTINEIPVQGTLNSLAVGDVNLDHIADLLIDTSQGIELNPGKGDGTFDWTRTYPAGFLPGNLTIADLNEDGRVDLAAVLTPFPSLGVPAYVQVLLNDAAGAFLGDEYHHTSDWPVTVLLADLTGDGWPDLLETGDTGANVTMRTGLRDGTFSKWPQQLTMYPTNEGGFSPPTVVADFNQDGLLDIATQHSPTVDIYYNHSVPTQFTIDATFPLSSVTGLASADLDHNGFPDLVATQGNTNRVFVILNDITGSKFLEPTPYLTGGWPSKVAIADMDADGELDVVVSNYSDSTVGLYRGLGAGVLATPAVFSAGVRPLFLHVSDLNHDALPDVVVDDRDASSLAILLNQGGGVLGAGVAYSTGDAPQDFAIADFNGDGTPDLAVPEQYANGLGFFYGRGDGTFLPHVARQTGYQCTAVVSGDIDKDGKPDLVFAAKTQDSLVVMLNRQTCR